MMRKHNDKDDDDDAADDEQSNALYVAQPERKSQIGAASLAFKKNELDQADQVKIEEKKKIEISENSENSNEDQTKVNSSVIADDRSDLVSSKQMMIQKLLDDLQRVHTSNQPLQYIDQNVNVKEIVAETNQNKIVYNKSELMSLNVLGMPMDNIQRLVTNNEKVLLVLKSSYFPFVSAELICSLTEPEERNKRDLPRAIESRFMNDGQRQPIKYSPTSQLTVKPIDASPLNLPVATPEEMEVFAWLSKKSVKPVSNASCLMGFEDMPQLNKSVDEASPLNTPVAILHELDVHAKSASNASLSTGSEITIDSKGDGAEDIKARLLQRSKTLKEKIGNLSKK